MATIPGGTYGIEYGTNSNDVIHLGDGNWFAYGDKGNDTIFGNSGTDILFGENGNDTLVGNDGYNLLFGGKGNDTLIGGQDGDLLDGGAGVDLLAGGGGDDTLIGGDGNDTFVFASGGGRDLVMDFQDGDVLQIQRNINGLHIGNAADLASRVYSDADGNAVIDLGLGDSITLVDVSADDVKADPNSFIKIH